VRQGNVQLYNSLMDLVAKSALYGFAGPLDGYGVLRRMRDGGVAPTAVTFNALLEVGNEAIDDSAFSDRPNALLEVPACVGMRIRARVKGCNGAYACV
jgi:hypothetical protein